MKKRTMIFGILILLGSIRLPAQSHEIVQLTLNLEKLIQLKQILSDLEKGYRIVKTGYNTIRDLSKGNFSLHKTFLDGLMQVSPTVRNYYKVAGIIDRQILLVREYKLAHRRFQESGHFHPEELSYLARVYDRLLKASLRNLEELTIVVTSGELRMSDDERLQTIDRIYDQMEDKLRFLRYFNNRTSIMALQRQDQKQSNRHLREAYGIED